MNKDKLARDLAATAEKLDLSNDLQPYQREILRRVMSGKRLVIVTPRRLTPLTPDPAGAPEPESCQMPPEATR
jgi:hypothetical protein